MQFSVPGKPWIFCKITEALRKVMKIPCAPDKPAQFVHLASHRIPRLCVLNDESIFFCQLADLNVIFKSVEFWEIF